MMIPVWFSLLAALFLVVLFPLLFGEVMATSLVKLHLSPQTALALLVGIIAGGLVNIPVRRTRRTVVIEVHPLATFGVHDLWPRLRRVRRDVIVAVNVGGCLIPTGLAIYEVLWLYRADPRLLWAVGVASIVNVAICYRLAQPVPRVGIALPGLVPALVAAALALVLAPEQAPAVAYVAGVAGPLIGADLLHLKDIERVAAGVLSIGGAGTFDGIVLSGIVAAYLA